MVQIADYQCLKGHQLTLSNTFYKCNICGVSRHCKSYCDQCNEKDSASNASYCIVCRPIRCTKYNCPNGHAMQKRVDKRGASCDICGITVNKISAISFSDAACDFDTCLSCHMRLPESLDLLPSTDIIAE